MVVADQHDVGGVQSGLKLLRIEERIIVAEGLAELAKVFAAAVRILGADFSLHSGQGVELPGAAAGAQIDGGRHIHFSVLTSHFSVLTSQLPVLSFLALTSCSTTPYAPNFGAALAPLGAVCLTIRRKI